MPARRRRINKEYNQLLSSENLDHANKRQFEAEIKEAAAALDEDAQTPDIRIGFL